MVPHFLLTQKMCSLVFKNYHSIWPLLIFLFFLLKIPLPCTLHKLHTSSPGWLECPPEHQHYCSKLQPNWNGHDYYLATLYLCLYSCCSSKYSSSSPYPYCTHPLTSRDIFHKAFIKCLSSIPNSVSLITLFIIIYYAPCLLDFYKIQ